ncbi:hypothetical protein [Celeribacter sp. PS-C1]|uniref:hypothetical protein n=1 Tax=Celeribacter sp. PS-C1 TaxID=2820813 RepID=UPI001CA55DCB|nr:hypothetical protein [Celeribacter sp. PS-C1]MBW6418290.1 hypothetical protein [Celeribacter sp. PS-C1]
MILLNNQKLKKTEIDRIHAQQALASAVAHWPSDELQGLDDRVIFLTVHVATRDEIQTVIPGIYLKIRKAFGFKDRPINQRISFIAAGDFRGTRNNAVGCFDFEAPHIHGIIILPKALAPEDDDNWEAVLEELRRVIAELEEVFNMMRLGREEVVVDLRKAVFDRSDLQNLILYTTKADRKYFDVFGDLTKCRIFPLEDIRNGYRLQHAKVEIEYRTRLHLERDKLYAQVANQRFDRFETEHLSAMRAKDDATRQKAQARFKYYIH